MNLKRLLVPLALVIIIFASSWSLFRPGLFVVHDYLHVARIGEMSRMLADGQFPPRWSSNFGFGYGMPLFQFYAPLPYLLGALLHFGRLPLELNLKLLFLLTNLVTVVGMYLLGKKLWGKYAGIFMAAAVTLAPYRAVNLFVRGALSEAFGMMTFPWILLSLYLIIRENRPRYWLLLSLSVTVLLLSHNLSALIFLPLSGVVALGMIIWQKYTQNQQLEWRQSVFSLIKGYGLAALLASFYTVPALLEKNYTKVDEFIVGGYFDYAVHFLGLKQFLTENWGYGASAYGMYDEISFFLGFGQILALGLALLGLVMLMIKSGKRKNYFPSFFWAVLFLITLYLTHGKSKFIWDLVEPLKYLQFPWRWLSAATFFLALFSASALALLKPRSSQLAFVGLSVLIVLVNWRYFAPSEYLEDNSELYYLDETRIKNELSYVLPDYIPVQLDENLQPAETEFFGEYTGAEVLSFNSVSTKIKTNFEEAQTIIFARADYPGWKVYLNDRETAKRVTETGLIGVAVPAGENQVEVKLETTQVRRLSDLTSAIGLVILLFFVTLEFIKGQKAHA